MAQRQTDNQLLTLLLLLFDSFGIEINQSAASLIQLIMKGEVSIATKIKRLNKEIGEGSFEAALIEVKGYRSPKTNTNQLFMKKLTELADRKASIKKPASFALALEFSKTGNIFAHVKTRELIVNILRDFCRHVIELHKNYRKSETKTLRKYEK